MEGRQDLHQEARTSGFYISSENFSEGPLEAVAPLDSAFPLQRVTLTMIYRLAVAPRDTHSHYTRQFSDETRLHQLANVSQFLSTCL